MEHQTQVDILKRLFNMLDNDTNVDAGIQLRNPTTSYTCPDLAATEWTEFFETWRQSGVSTIIDPYRALETPPYVE